MARNKRLKLVEAPSGGNQGVWSVVDRSSGQAYGTLYLQNNGGGYRVRLSNYPHRLSRNWTSKDQALSYVEREVF